MEIGVASAISTTWQRTQREKSRGYQDQEQDFYESNKTKNGVQAALKSNLRVQQNQKRLLFSMERKISRPMEGGEAREQAKAKGKDEEL